jgi:hypothetical protein
VRCWGVMNVLLLPSVVCPEAGAQFLGCRNVGDHLCLLGLTVSSWWLREGVSGDQDKERRQNPLPIP